MTTSEVGFKSRKSTLSKTKVSNKAAEEGGVIYCINGSTLKI